MKGYSKYKNVKYIDDEGNKWDSKKEFKFYLQLLENDKIKDIERQVEYILIPKQTNENGKFLFHPVKYKLDFKYYSEEDNKVHYVDVKGFKTPEYKIKKKLMWYIHKIFIEEV